MALLDRNHTQKLCKQASDRRNFRNVSESFGNYNPSLKRSLFKINERYFSLRQWRRGGGSSPFSFSNVTGKTEAKPPGISALNSILHLLNPGVVLDQAGSRSCGAFPKARLAPSPWFVMFCFGTFTFSPPIIQMVSGYSHTRPIDITYCILVLKSCERSLEATAFFFCPQLLWHRKEIASRRMCSARQDAWLTYTLTLVLMGGGCWEPPCLFAYLIIHSFRTFSLKFCPQVISRQITRLGQVILPSKEFVMLR